MKHSGIYVSALAALLLAGCSAAGKDAYTIEGKITNEKLEGRTVYLQDALDGTIRYDSATVTHGTFTFSGKQEKPVVRELLVQETDSDAFPVTLPIVLENGVIEVDLGNRVYVGNTKLNKEMMEVLLAIDSFTDREFTEVATIKTEFAALLMEQIVKHANSPVGKYLFDAYQRKLTEEQKKEVQRILIAE